MLNEMERNDPLSVCDGKDHRMPAPTKSSMMCPGEELPPRNDDHFSSSIMTKTRSVPAAFTHARVGSFIRACRKPD